MPTTHIQELTQALQRRTMALFIGADLPRDVTGLPSRADLVRDLARRKGLDESLSLAEVAQRVSRAGNRWEFTAFIRDALDTADKSPQPFHRRIVEVVSRRQIETLITTAYDNLLELAFQKAGVGVNRIVRGSDVAFSRPDRPTLIKLYGDAQQPDTLVVTEDDHFGLWRDRDKEDLLDEVRSVLRKKVILFLGYNLTDPDFNLLWREVLDRAGRFALGAYAAWPDLSQDERRVWEDRQVRVIEAESLALLERLGAAVSDEPTQRLTIVQPTLVDSSVAFEEPFPVEEERALLRQELAQHKRNLYKLRERRAKYGIDVPVSVLNQIEDEEREIARIEAELESLGESSK